MDQKTRTQNLIVRAIAQLVLTRGRMQVSAVSSELDVMESAIRDAVDTAGLRLGVRLVKSRDELRPVPSWARRMADDMDTLVEQKVEMAREIAEVLSALSDAGQPSGTLKNRVQRLIDSIGRAETLCSHLDKDNKSIRDQLQRVSEEHETVVRHLTHVAEAVAGLSGKPIQVSSACSSASDGTVRTMAASNLYEDIMDRISVAQVIADRKENQLMALSAQLDAARMAIRDLASDAGVSTEMPSLLVDFPGLVENIRRSMTAERVALIDNLRSAASAVCAAAGYAPQFLERKDGKVLADEIRSAVGVIETKAKTAMRRIDDGLARIQKLANVVGEASGKPIADIESADGAVEAIISRVREMQAKIEAHTYATPTAVEDAAKVATADLSLDPCSDISTYTGVVIRNLNDGRDQAPAETFVEIQESSDHNISWGSLRIFDGQDLPTGSSVEVTIRKVAKPETVLLSAVGLNAHAPLTRKAIANIMNQLTPHALSVQQIDNGDDKPTTFRCILHPGRKDKFASVALGLRLTEVTDQAKQTCLCLWYEVPTTTTIQDVISAFRNIGKPDRGVFARQPNIVWFQVWPGDAEGVRAFAGSMGLLPIGETTTNPALTPKQISFLDSFRGGQLRWNAAGTDSPGSDYTVTVVEADEHLVHYQYNDGPSSTVLLSDAARWAPVQASQTAPRIYVWFKAPSPEARLLALETFCYRGGLTAHYLDTYDVIQICCRSSQLDEMKLLGRTVSLKYIGQSGVTPDLTIHERAVLCAIDRGQTTWLRGSEAIHVIRANEFLIRLRDRYEEKTVPISLANIDTWTQD